MKFLESMYFYSKSYAFFFFHLKEYVIRKIGKYILVDIENPLKKEKNDKQKASQNG